MEKTQSLNSESTYNIQLDLTTSTMQSDNYEIIIRQIYSDNILQTKSQQPLKYKVNFQHPPTLS